MLGRKFLIRSLKTIYFGMILSLILWALPMFQTHQGGGTSLAKEVGKLSGPFFRWSGLWQGWSMFAPNPSNLNFSIQVAIEFYDGKFEFITMPQLHLMGSWEAYRKERHRKFGENINRKQSSSLWPQVAEYYHKIYSKQGSIKNIELIRWWSTVERPDLDSPPPPLPTYMNYEDSYIFYTAKYPKP